MISRSLIFCLLALFPAAEVFSGNLPDTIAIPKGSRMSTDQLENSYVITPTNDIIKYDKTGKKLATANFKVLGNITFLDASNPFEIFVFYRDQNKVIFLDNLLNQRGECDMESIGVSQIACIGRSSDNQIWLFDMSDLKLKKYSKDLKLLIESASFNTLPIGNDINPTQIKDANSALYILNDNSIYEFDVFANFSKAVLNDTINEFQLVNNRLVYFKNGNLFVYDKQSFKLSTLNAELPEGCMNARIEKERLFILNDESLILQTYSE